MGIGFVLVLLLGLGASCGIWLAVCHYRPLLDIANIGLASAKQARDNLETLAGEQGMKLGELVLASELRERDAARAIDKAKVDAKSDYAAANKLLRARTGGNSARAAESIIDQELRL